MTDALPPDAVEAAAEALYRRKYAHSRTAMMPWESTDAGSREYERNGATAALLAAQPAWEAWLREKVAQEIEAARDVVLITVADFQGKDPFTLKVSDRDHLDRIAAEFARICREGGTP